MFLDQSDFEIDLMVYPFWQIFLFEIAKSKFDKMRVLCHTYTAFRKYASVTKSERLHVDLPNFY